MTWKNFNRQLNWLWRSGRRLHQNLLNILRPNLLLVGEKTEALHIPFQDSQDRMETAKDLMLDTNKNFRTTKSCHRMNSFPFSFQQCNKYPKISTLLTFPSLKHMLSLTTRGKLPKILLSKSFSQGSTTNFTFYQTATQNQLHNNSK